MVGEEGKRSGQQGIWSDNSAYIIHMEESVLIQSSTGYNE